MCLVTHPCLPDCPRCFATIALKSVRWSTSGHGRQFQNWAGTQKAPPGLFGAVWGCQQSRGAPATGHASSAATSAATSVDLQQLDIEAQGGVGGDDAARAAPAEGQRTRQGRRQPRRLGRWRHAQGGSTWRQVFRQAGRRACSSPAVPTPNLDCSCCCCWPLLAAAAGCCCCQASLPDVAAAGRRLTLRRRARGGRSACSARRSSSSSRLQATVGVQAAAAAGRGRQQHIAGNVGQQGAQHCRAQAARLGRPEAAAAMSGAPCHAMPCHAMCRCRAGRQAQAGLPAG